MALTLINNQSFIKLNAGYKELNYTESLEFYHGLLVGLYVIKLHKNISKVSDIISVILNEGKPLNGLQVAELTSAFNLIEGQLKKRKLELLIPMKKDRPEDMETQAFIDICLKAFIDESTGVYYGLAYLESKDPDFLDFKDAVDQFMHLDCEGEFDWSSFNSLISYLQETLIELAKDPHINADKDVKSGARSKKPRK